jgi:cytidine deaminase
MSINPFAADVAGQERFDDLSRTVGMAVRAAASPALSLGRAVVGANLGAVLPAAEAERLIAQFGLADVRELMLLLLDTAKDHARPPISNFFVGAVGLEAETGNLILGGNVEFPGTHLGFTLHGEGFVFTRAFSRGTNISVIALGEAHPCAHCRQYLSEFAASGDLKLIDPLGHTLSLSQLYPWPFDPGYLGQRGAVPGSRSWPNLKLGRDDIPAGVAAALLVAGARAHAPYSRCPGAVVIQLADGNFVSGMSIESVAFNPTIQPIQAGIIDLLAHGYDYDDIVHVTLGTVLDGAVDYADSTAEMLGAVAPQAGFTVCGWSEARPWQR